MSIDQPTEQVASQEILHQLAQPSAVDHSIFSRRTLLMNGLGFGAGLLLHTTHDTEQDPEPPESYELNRSLLNRPSSVVLDNGHVISYQVDRLSSTDFSLKVMGKEYRTTNQIPWLISKLIETEDVYEDKDGIHVVTNFGYVILSPKDFKEVMYTLGCCDLLHPHFEIQFTYHLYEETRVMVETAFKVASIDLNEKQKIDFVRVPTVSSSQLT